MQAVQRQGYEQEAVLYMAMELSNSNWKLGFSNGQRTRRKSIEARDRVRLREEVQLARQKLGLEPEMVYRHPFPGPGLGVRILGKVREEYLEPLAKADHIFIEELRAHDLYDSVSQAFAVFLPVKSVGVMG